MASLAGNTDGMTTQSRQPPNPRPLILLTRPLAQSQRFAEQVRAAVGPVEILISPVLAIRPLPVAPPQGDFGALILTSQNAAVIAAALGFPLPRQAYCVGDRTAEAARQAGFTAIRIGGDAAGLIKALLDIRPTGRLLHLHGVETRGDVAQGLTSAGIETVSLPIYDQVALVLSVTARQALDKASLVILPVFSPRTAQIIAGQGPFQATIRVVALSQAVAVAAQALNPDRLEIAESPDAVGMQAALRGILRHPCP